ncbi:MAG: hypothetical protein Kow0027_23500 [Saprospiraceae bacterium]
MKSQLLILLGLLLSLAACESDYPSSQNTADGSGDSTGLSAETPLAEQPPARPLCDTAGLLLDGNEKWMADEHLLIRILATEATEDSRLGDSHRHLEVRNENCEILLSTDLEVDQSPDFPYTIAKINYNKVNGWLAIQGFSQFYLLHLNDLKLVGPLKPAYLNERYAEDAQSGRINKLEVWEDYLIGHAEDLGTFVYSLKHEGPKPTLPIAEYSADGGFEYHSLFMLHSGDEPEKYQLLAPEYNPTAGSLVINPLLESPTRLDGRLNSAFRDNRYLVIKAFDEAGNQTPVAVDMLLQKRIPLPDEVARQSDTDIINWMRSNS